MVIYNSSLINGYFWNKTPVASQIKIEMIMIKLKHQISNNSKIISMKSIQTL